MRAPTTDARTPRNMMHSAVRLSGVTLLVAGLLGASVPAAHPSHGPAYYADPMTAPVHLLLFVAVLILSLGLPGLVLAQPERQRSWTAVGVALTFAGEWLLDGTHGIVDGAILPALVQHGAAGVHGAGLPQLIAAGPLGVMTDVGVPMMIAGCITLGITLGRGGVVPRWAAVLLALCWVLVPLSFIVPSARGVGVALPYVAFAAVGSTLLWRGARADATHGDRAYRRADGRRSPAKCEPFPTVADQAGGIQGGP